MLSLRDLSDTQIENKTKQRNVVAERLKQQIDNQIKQKLKTKTKQQ